MILIDTSVWIGHLRQGNPFLVHLLEEDQVLMHPWIIGELALGSIQKRSEFLALLACLPSVQVVESPAQLAFIETNRLWSRGIGWVDAQLLAVCHSHPCRLLTRDARLQVMAAELGVAAASPNMV